MAPSKASYKIWRAVPSAEAGFMVTPESAIMAGSPNCFIATTNRGTAISGPLSIIATGESIRVGGLFVGMNDFVKMIPSTIVTPIPSQIPFPPVAMFTHVAKTLPFFLAILAG